MDALLDLTTPSRSHPPAASPPLVLLPGGRTAPAMADVYRRRRIVAVALGLVMVVGLLAASRTLALALAPPPPGAAPAVAVEAGVPTATVVVARGDTLWSIARRMRPQGDVRAVVDRLAAAHGPGALQPGERLVIEAGGGR